MNLNEFVDHAIGVPFEPWGRSFLGWDCWGLVVVAYQEVLGIKLPGYSEDYDPADAEVGTPKLSSLIRHVQLGEWYEVSEPEPMDVAVYLAGGRPVHVGLMIDKSRAIQARDRIGTYVSHHASAFRAGPLEAVYRRAQ